MENPKYILRAKFEPRKGVWRIKKKLNTGAGKWKLFGSSDGYVSKFRAEEKIKYLIEHYPDMYQ